MIAYYLRLINTVVYDTNCLQHHIPNVKLESYEQN